jgi:hypothetical protein
MRLVTVLAHRIDTLYLWFPGEGISGLDLIALDQGKKRAQELNEPQEVELSGHRFFVSPKGVDNFGWRATCDGIELFVGRGAVGASVHLGARVLAEYGHEALWVRVRQLADDLGLGEAQVSRVDVAVDVQGLHLTPHELLYDFSCRARFSPPYPNPDHPTSRQFGRGETVVRVYDKSVQIVEKHIPWWRTVWAQDPSYDPSESVWRIEVQARGKVLRERGLSSVEALFSSPGAVLDYGMGWAQLKVSSGDKTISRRDQDPRWEQIRAAVWSGQPLPLLREESRMLSGEQAARRALSALATLAAQSGCDDLVETIAELRKIARDLESRKVPVVFADMVEARRARLGIVRDLPEGVPF